MLQWPVIVLLTVSMFVGRVCPVLQKEGHVNSTVNTTVKPTANVTTNTNNTIAASSTNDSKKIEPLAKAVEDKKATLNETNSSSPSINATKTNATNTNVTNVNATNANATNKNVTNANITNANVTNANLTNANATNANITIVPLVNEKHNCNSTIEQLDMINCYVTPHDSDEDTEDAASTSTAEPTTTTVTASNKTEVNNTESQIPKDTPKTEEKEKNKGASTTVVLLNHTEVHHTYYDVATEPSHPTNAIDSGTDPKVGTNRTDDSVSSVAPLVAKNAPSTGSENVVQELKSTDQSRQKSMPSGMIALVTAISFAVAIAIVYIGMIVWRRYIEYRYGHRELLVNELEFDTNDLRHFEL